jgi:riboflavin synthase
MFTGIIQAMSEVINYEEKGDINLLTLKIPEDWELTIGQSIACDGVCLTVVSFDKEQFTVELMPETTKRSTFGEKLGTKINLERAMSAQGLFEGHIVQGHVDSMNKIIEIDTSSPQWRTLKVAYPANKASLLVEKGSITLSGTSLTIVDVADDWFSVSLIPHTLEHTTLGDKKAGESLNVEYDVIAKLIARQTQNSARA